MRFLPGAAYKLAGDGYGQTTIVDPDTDDSLMVARAVICTPTIDAESEVILPSGVRLDRYTLNPVVLWDHGMGCIPFPLGTSRRPGDNTLDLIQADNRMEAACYFTAAIPEGPQVYQLVKERIVNATSIHVLPDARWQAMAPDGRAVKIIENSEMVEWSWGCIGCNPDAVAKTLAHGRLNGEPIRPAIKSLLLPFAPARRVLGKGADFTSGATKMLDPSKLSDDELATAVASITQYDDATQQAIRAEATKRDAAKAVGSGAGAGSGAGTGANPGEAAKTTADELAAAAAKGGAGDNGGASASGDAAKPGDKAAEKAGEKPAEAVKTEGGGEGNVAEGGSDPMAPLGAQVLTALHESVSGLIATATSALGPLENIPVKEAILVEIERLQESIATMEGLFADQYPDLPGLTNSGEEDAALEEDAVKTWLCENNRNVFQFAGVGQRLGAIATAKNLTAVQTTNLRAVKTFLDGLLSKARDGREKATDDAAAAKTAADEATLARLETKLEAASKKLLDALPARRRPVVPVA